jgi:steroid delta-isomerase-like uncharacterized protein
MSVEDNKRVVHRYWQDLWNEKNRSVLAEIASEKTALHFAQGQAHQPPSLEKWFETALVAFPDVRFTVHDLFAEGDRVVARWSYIATNTGPFLGRPATGKQVTDTGINIFRIENGKIADMWLVQDSLGLLQQLGFVP